MAKTSEDVLTDLVRLLGLKDPAIWYETSTVLSVEVSQFVVIDLIERLEDEELDVVRVSHSTGSRRFRPRKDGTFNLSGIVKLAKEESR